VLGSALQESSEVVQGSEVSGGPPERRIPVLLAEHPHDPACRTPPETCTDEPGSHQPRGLLHRRPGRRRPPPDRTHELGPVEHPHPGRGAEVVGFGATLDVVPRQPEHRGRWERRGQGTQPLEVQRKRCIGHDRRWEIEASEHAGAHMVADEHAERRVSRGDAREAPGPCFVGEPHRLWHLQHWPIAQVAQDSLAQLLLVLVAVTEVAAAVQQHRSVSHRVAQVLGGVGPPRCYVADGDTEVRQRMARSEPDRRVTHVVVIRETNKGNTFNSPEVVPNGNQHLFAEPCDKTADTHRLAHQSLIVRRADKCGVVTCAPYGVDAGRRDGREQAVSAVTVTAVSKRFGPVDALSPVDLVVEPGEVVTLLGPSGCGKTTLLRIVGGLEDPTAGKVLVDGLPPASARRQKRIALVPQSPGLLPWRTVRANARLLLEVNRRANGGAGGNVDELLAEVGLAEFAGAYPHELSGGMQQRVALVRAFALDAPLLLMDEPFAALDEMTREDMRHLLVRLCERTGATVLFVTHSIPEAAFVSDRVAVMTERPGRIHTVLDIGLERPRRPELEDDPAFFALETRLRSALREGSGR